MLKHLLPNPVLPSRVVILGAKGFVASTTASNLRARGVNTLTLGREELDLFASGADVLLASKLHADDSLFIVSALAPCKNAEMLEKNIVMMNVVLRSLKKQPVAHIVYVSSDAVYADSMDPLTESSPKAPTSLHGVMHLARELMLTAEAGAPVAFLRPTLIYGAKDPHNGYGPNRFVRLAVEGNEIVLFGEGEEQRDHVSVNDVAELAARMLLHRSIGELNAVSGEVISFDKAAKQLVSLTGGKSIIKSSHRSGPMPHNGYRPFDPSSIRLAFPDFSPCPIERGFAEMAHILKG